MGDIRDYRVDEPGLDISDHIVGQFCVCGSNLFRTVVAFDDEYNIAQYALDGECLECNARVKLPTPLDKE